jgi:hypothetical protein
MAKIKKSQDGGKLNRLGPTPLISRPKEKPVPIPPPGYPKKSSKPMMKAKNGKSFPDLNKDGKVTRADILKGRGVIAKNGKPVKKAAIGALLPLAMKAAPMIAGMFGGKGKGGGGGGLGGMLGGLLGGKNGKTIKKSKSGSSIKKVQTGGYTFPKPNPNEGDFLIGETGPMRKTKVKQRSESGDYVTKTVTRERKGAKNVSTKTRRTLQGFLNHAPKVSELKRNGGKMKTCKGGC